MTLTTAPIAFDPYRTDEAPRTTSMRDTIESGMRE